MLPPEVFPVRLGALLGWPRHSYNTALVKIWHSETLRDLDAAAEFICSVAADMDESLIKALRNEWQRTRIAIETENERQRKWNL